MRRSNVSLRFLHWPNPVNERDRVFAKLLELALNTKIEIVTEENIKVDIEIESVYAVTVSIRFFILERTKGHLLEIGMLI